MKRIFCFLCTLLLLTGCVTSAPALTETAPAISATFMPIPVTPTPVPTPKHEKVTDYELKIRVGDGYRVGVFTGELIDGVPTGVGSFTSENKDGVQWTYEGDWENGTMQGNGKTRWKNGQISVGEYKGGLMNGKGEIYLNGKVIYTGEFKNDLYEGEGTLYDKNGNVEFSGAFVNGEPQLTEEQKAQKLQDEKDACEKIAYKDLARSPDQYLGKKIKFTGKVIQVLESEMTSEYRINVTRGSYGIYKDTVYLFYNRRADEPRILEDDMITFWGDYDGLITYKSVMGQEITIPSVIAFAVEIKQ